MIKENPNADSTEQALYYDPDSLSNAAISVLVECLVKDSLKFELNKELNIVLPDSVNGLPRLLDYSFPANYGFTEIFVSQDGDYLDAFIFSEYRLRRGEYTKCEPKFLVLMTDNLIEDSKLICSHRNAHIKLEEIEFFMKNYSKDTISIDGIIDLKESTTDIIALILDYQSRI